MVAKLRKSGGHKQGGIYETQLLQAAVTNNEERKGFTMANQIFMRVDEVAEERGVSVPYAYKLIRQMNEELEKAGFIVVAGKIPRAFWEKKFFGYQTSA